MKTDSSKAIKVLAKVAHPKTPVGEKMAGLALIWNLAERNGGIVNLFSPAVGTATESKSLVTLRYLVGEVR